MFGAGRVGTSSLFASISAGATIISEHVVATAIRDGRLRALTIDLPPRDFVLLRHSERQPGLAARALIDLLTGESKPERRLH